MSATFVPLIACTNDGGLRSARTAVSYRHAMSAGGCAAHSSASGVGVEDHLVNGASFAPWMRAGVGFRSMTFERSQAGLGTDSASYAGFEWLHLALGGEWYPFRQVGFGPYMALDLGWYGKRPQNGSESSHHSFFSIGLRVAVDPAR